MGEEVTVLMIVLITVLAQTSAYHEGATCWQGNGTPGLCMNASTCEHAFGTMTSDLWEELCCVEGDVPVFCCGDHSPTNLFDVRSLQYGGTRVAEQKCKQYAQLVFWEIQSPILLVNADVYNVSTCAMTAETLIVGGVKADPNEFPHMAALGFGNKNNIKWLCGGSLISERFVLTAAHCMRSRNRGEVKWVQLGVLNIAHTGDGETFTVAERIPHHGYRPPALYNDIALLRLESDVTFSPSIRPACLYSKRGNLLHDTAIATGWGKNDSGAAQRTNELMKVHLTLQPLEDCNRTFQQVIQTSPRQLGRGVDAQSMICAGEHHARKDTCGGDSGGPLQITLQNPFCMYSIIGLTSFGIPECGSGSPAIYTRVSHYISWIENHVWPTTCETH